MLGCCIIWMNLGNVYQILCSEDRYTPVPVAVKELVVQEGGKSTITTEYLLFTDEDTEPASLGYLVLQPPEFGYLQLANEPGLFCTIFKSCRK